MRSDDPARTLWNPQIELLDAEQLHNLQLERLRKQLRYNYDRSPLYRDKFDAAGATPDSVDSLQAFAQLPLTTKQEQRDAQARSLSEFGDPLALMGCARRDEVVRINATSGTTGTPTLYALTAQDVGVVNEMHARKYWRAGVRPGDVMLQALSLSMFTGGLPLSQGIQHLGACVVPVGVEGGVQRVLQFLELTRATELIATPSFGQHLIERCVELTGRPADALGIHRFFCAGEPGGGAPATRQLLADGFNAEVYDHTGGGHAFHAISCNAGDGEYRGMHFVSPDHCLLELVHPAHKTPITIEDNAEGEVVWTFLDWQGGPFMRFAMGDIARVWTSPCDCGLPGLRFEIIGRADDMLIVKGVNIYPAAVKDLVDRLQPQLSGRFQIVLDRPGPKVNPPLRVRLELSGPLTTTDRDALATRFIELCRSELRVTPQIEWCDSGTLGRVLMKSRHIVIEPKQ